jgi:hypothetical protein
MPKISIPPGQVGTRGKNKTTHPGKVVKDAKQKRRSKAEMKRDGEAEAKAKADLAEARQESINRTAEFERADIANEDIVDATPRPAFTPKPRPLSRNQRSSSLTPFASATDIEVFDDPDEAPFIPGSKSLVVDADDSAVENDDPPPSPFMPGSKSSVDADDSAVENDDPPPPTPAKKKKAKITPKATTARVDTKKLGETANRKRKVVEDVEGDIPQDSNDEQPQEPKPKKMKVKMRDEINVATTKILEIQVKKTANNKYAEMVNSMGSSGKPASNVPSHSSLAVASGGRPLKREGAIADIKKSVGGKKLNREGAIADLTYPDKSTAFLPDLSSTRPDPGSRGNNIR